MKSYGVWPDCALLRKSREDTHGLPYRTLAAKARTCDLLLVRGGRLLNRPELTDPIPCRVYIDGNPGVPQVLLEQGRLREARVAIERALELGGPLLPTYRETQEAIEASGG